MTLPIPGKLYQLEYPIGKNRYWFFNLAFEKLYFSSPIWIDDTSLKKGDIVLCLNSYTDNISTYTSFLIGSNIVELEKYQKEFLSCWKLT